MSNAISGARPGTLQGRAPSLWEAPASGRFETDTRDEAPLIKESDFAKVALNLDIWDAWPVQKPDGHPAEVGDGSSLWMALGAPRFDEPDERHGHARIHLLQRIDDGWIDLGPAMPDGFSPGSREWSGSAVLDMEASTVTLYFTATGKRGEAELTFTQRIFRAYATLVKEGRTRLTDWRDLEEIVVRDPVHYMDSDGGKGRVGTIKAFRDPSYFLDPEDGRSHLLFAASAAKPASQYNGVVGMASACDGRLDKWQIVPPIISADGLNNELERPHAIYREGLYYVFWSTQRHVFNPDGPTGPTGLYGMVSNSLDGPWRPLNKTGLVFANPASAPAQAYSWLVMPDMKVTSFVDDWGDGNSDRTFGATFAPDLMLKLEGDRARLVA